jgi:ketosteroid isomerase-like protein
MTASSHEGAENEVRRAERALYDAMVAKDWAALDRILASDLAYGHSTGVMETKGEYLAALGKDVYLYEAISSRDVTVKIFGDAALMHGIVDMDAAGGGAKRVLHLLFVLAFVKRDGRWQLYLRHATRIP